MHDTHEVAGPQREIWQAWCLGCGWGTDHDSYGSASDATRAHHCAEPDTEVRGPTNVRGVRPIMRGLDDEEAAAEVQLDDGQGDHIADGAATDSIRPRGRRKESATR